MLINTTYKNKDNDLLIEDLVGKAFSLKKKLLMGGAGSARMIIDSVSPNLQRTLLNGHDLNYANIELRPKGILIRITRRLDNFTWILPYYHLYIYKTNGLSLHGQGQFVHFRSDRHLTNNKSFLKKLSDLRLEFLQDYYII